MIIFCALVITPVIFFACYVNIPWMQSDAFYIYSLINIEGND